MFGRMCRVIGDSQVQEHFLGASRPVLLDYISGLRQAMQRYSSDPSIIPPRIVRSTPDGSTLHMYMPVIDDVFSGLKTLGFSPTSGEGFTGVVNVTEAHSGTLIGAVMAKQLTGVRTAMASCIGLVNRIDSFGENVQLTVFGTGLQVFWHVYMACKLLDTKSVTVNVVYRSSPMDVALLKQYLPNANFVQFKSDKSRISEAVSHSDIIFGCIPSEQPALLAEYLEQSKEPSYTYISLIGSYKPHMHECDGALVKKFQEQGAKIIVDSKEHTLLEAGELIDANARPDELVEIGEFDETTDNVQMKCENGKRVTLCKIVGLSIMDVSVAKMLLANVNS